MKKIIIFLLLLMTSLLTAQPTNEQTKKAIEDLQEFIAIPNFGLNKDDISKNINWLDAAFSKRGFSTQVLETEGNPLFFAEMKMNKKWPTILFYMHLDGQAIDRSKWSQDSPYKAVIKKKDANGEWVEVDDLGNSINPDWRLFGRSTSDDKGPIIGFLNAMDIMKTKGMKPRFNVKVVLDAEEELGSGPLAAAVKTHKEILVADALIINDGPVHTSGKPTLNFGCRGIMTVNMTIYGPVKPQHSGHYGNYAPNPIFRMAELLANMKDDEGRVIINGYYDGIEITDEIRNVLAQVPDDINTIHNLLQIHTPEKVGQNYQESLQYPSLNARGIQSGWVGAQARTIVPHNATVAIDMRLVPESIPSHLVEVTRAHIESQGYHIVDHEPTYEERMKYPKILFFHASKATLPFRTDMNTKTGKWLEKVIKKGMNQDPVKVRIMGGTVPIASFVNELNIPAVIVPMVNPDNNQHSPNENLRIGHLQYSIELFMHILNSKAEL